MKILHNGKMFGILPLLAMATVSGCKFFTQESTAIQQSSPTTETSGHKAYIPSNTDRATDLFVVYGYTTVDLITDYIRVIEKQNKSLVPENRIKLNLLVNDDNKEDLDKFLKEHPSTAVTVLHTPGEAAVNAGDGAGDWLQDKGEAYFDATGAMRFLHGFKTIADETSMFLSVLETRLEIKLNGVYDKKLAHKGSREGGNIEGMPGGSVYVGDNVGADLLAALKEIAGADKVVLIPTHVTSIGHVDEILQFIPVAKDKSNQCGYALAHADLLDGLRIGMVYGLLNKVQEGNDDKHSRKITTQEYKEAIARFTGVKASEIQLTANYFDTLPAKFNSKIMPEAYPSYENYKLEQLYVYKAFVAQNEILQGMKILKSQAQKDGCQDLATVSLPHMWTYGLNVPPVEEAATPQEALDFTTSNLSAFTNMTVINNTLVIPDIDVPSQLYYFLEEAQWKNLGGQFKGVIVTRLQQLGFSDEDIVFTKVPGAILGDGAAHCKTNIFRKRSF